MSTVRSTCIFYYSAELLPVIPVQVTLLASGISARARLASIASAKARSLNMERKTGYPRSLNMQRWALPGTSASASYVSRVLSPFFSLSWRRVDFAGPKREPDAGLRSTQQRPAGVDRPPTAGMEAAV